MARRNPPRRPPRVVRPGTAAAVMLASGLGAALVGAPGGAIGPSIVRADPAPDLTRARELYQSAEAAMQDGRYDDAARDYGAAYELSADPALFYKIGRASERAGKCDVALIYYARYLREGKPTEQFTALTRERMAACGGDRTGSGAGAGSDAMGPASGAAAGSAAGASATATGDTPGRASSAGGATGAGSGASPGPGDAAHRGSASANAGSPRSGNSPGNASGTAASTGATRTGGTASPEGPAGGPPAGSGSATAALIPPTREKIAWLMGGGAIALVTLGGVLAYAASSSENDVRDLYAGFAGQPPMFDAQTRKRYDDLVDQGRNYQHLSWAAFGLGGAAAVGAAILFALGRGDEPGPPRTPIVTPVVGPRGAGVSVRF